MVVIREMRIKPLVKGLLTFVPGVEGAQSHAGPEGERSASYCYGVWLKHLTLLWAHGMRSVPGSIAELGPGDSLGVGLAAILSGADTYYALDVVRYSNTEPNLKLLDDLVALFKRRAPRPTKGWPGFDEYLDEDLFPSHILNDGLLERTLSDERVAAIRDAIENPGSHTGAITVKYMVPWSGSEVIERGSVDVILSHTVLQHVVDLETTYQALCTWLRPQGMMTHQVSFTSMGLSKTWNGYRACSELYWRAMLGRRPFLINRQPPSVHRRLMVENGLDLVCDLRTYRTDGLSRSDLSRRWKGITDDDLTCSGAFIQAKK
jgi:hypothetical protein